MILLAEQGKVQGFFDNTKNADKLGGLVEDIRDAMMDYQVCISHRSFLSCLILALDFIATRYLRQELPAYRESHLPAFQSRGLTNGQESANLALLNGMYHTTDAGHRCGSREGCLRGTRKGVLGEIERWLMGEQEQRIFWLNGLAGTGKSTIAQTFAEMSFADGQLGASFFCSRDLEDRSNLQAIFPTLAFSSPIGIRFSERSYSRS